MRATSPDLGSCGLHADPLTVSGLLPDLRQQILFLVQRELFRLLGQRELEGVSAFAAVIQPCGAVRPEVSMLRRKVSFQPEGTPLWVMLPATFHLPPSASCTAVDVLAEEPGQAPVAVEVHGGRSEERRVGKECRL